MAETNRRGDGLEKIIPGIYVRFPGGTYFLHYPILGFFHIFEPVI